MLAYVWFDPQRLQVTVVLIKGVKSSSTLGRYGSLHPGFGYDCAFFCETFFNSGLFYIINIVLYFIPCMGSSIVFSLFSVVCWLQYLLLNT